MVAGLVLAGGLSRRFDGEDKGLQRYRGRPLIEHALDLLQGLDEVVISANRHHERYAGLGYPVVADQRQDYLGPLSGIETAMQQTGADALMVVPCDVVGAPDGWMGRLITHARELESPWVGTLDGDRPQPLLGYWSSQLLPLISGALDKSELRVMRLIAPWIDAALPLPEGEHLFNLNTPQALAEAQTTVG